MFLTLDHIRQAIALPDFDVLAAHRRMAPMPRPITRDPAKPGSAKLAAVLVLIFPIGDALWFALMRRNDYEGVHSGQMSLPGGRAEPGETWEQTALRETCEEFGICAGVTLLGALTPIYVPPSDFEIHPIVGCLSERPTWQPDPREVAAIIEVPLADLLDDSKKGVGAWKMRSGADGTIPHYLFGGQQVWGATAIMLSELEWRLRAVIA